MTSGVLAAAVLALWGAWTFRLASANRDLALALEADRQRNFSDMAYHVEQIQGLLGKGLVAGTTTQNMRYMSDVHQHASAAVTNFHSLPLPGQVQASTGKFLQQTGDFAVSLLRNEAAGRDMDGRTRSELVRLREESANLSAQLQAISTEYNKGGFRWNPPMRFSWANLRGRHAAGRPKPATGAQAPRNMQPGGWDRVGSSMERLPVMLYDGPFSDGVAARAPAVTGPALTQADAAVRLRAYVPGFGGYKTVAVTEVAGNLPAYSFQLAPAAAPAGGGHTAVADIARNGGYLIQFMNSRPTGKPTIDLARARQIGEQYLTSMGYRNMTPTYGQIEDGEATIAYAYRADGVIAYPDQIKVKVALDNGDILAVDARQYLMSHHARTDLQPTVTEEEARDKVNGALKIHRTQTALIPNQAGTGEILTWEFLTTFGNETYLVYVNAHTGAEEQVLQQVQTDGGTFAL